MTGTSWQTAARTWQAPLVDHDTTSIAPTNQYDSPSPRQPSGMPPGIDAGSGIVPIPPPELHAIADLGHAALPTVPRPRAARSS